MNIFAYHDSPWQSALWLDDVRKNKMITETSQILSTAMNTLVPDHGYEVFRSFNPNHPSNVWARASSGNFRWLVRYLRDLMIQRPNKDGSLHTCHCFVEPFDVFLMEHAKSFGETERLAFSNNAANTTLGISFKHIAKTTLAYRLYSRERWKLDNPQPTWNYGEKPTWA